MTTLFAPRPPRGNVSGIVGGSSALHRICEHQTVRRVQLFDLLHIVSSLQLQMHVLKAGQRALPRCADCPDPLAALDSIPDSNSDHGEALTSAIT
jgi:hypothetical protein